jgi:hypothetical protein
MIRLPFVALGLALCAVVTVCLAQQPSTSKSSAVPLPGSFDPVAALAAGQPGVPDVADAESLRAQLFELLKQKADMMTAEELKAALSQTEAELQELQASHALLDAKHLLQDVVQNHPRTQAARQAQTILANWEPPSDSSRVF